MTMKRILLLFLSCHAFSFKGKKTPNQQIISLITVCYADLFVH